MKIFRYQINEIIEDYFKLDIIEKKINIINNDYILSLNPFSTNNLVKINNNLDVNIKVDYNLEALDFLKSMENNSIDLILFDPPSNPNRMVYYFNKLKKDVSIEYTRTQYWSSLKKEISRIMKPNGYVISVSQNSGGIGKKFGFNIREIIIINHYNLKNDIFCVIDKKET